MRLKHRIVINVTDTDGTKTNVLKGADVRLPARLVRFLFGDYTQVYLLAPGQTVDSVDVREVKTDRDALRHCPSARSRKGGKDHEQN